MHLALIYVLLVWVFAKIPLINRSKVVAVDFNINLPLAVLHSYRCISICIACCCYVFIYRRRQKFEKQVSIYNSLAASAFVLLCYNPYYLWAVGFQLSYLAVLGIVIFQKPIYNCFYIKNKWLNKTWQLVSVSTAAQIANFPGLHLLFSPVS